MQDAIPAVAAAHSLDRLLAAWLARFTLGLSPASVMLACLDWLVHLAYAPGKQRELLEKATRKALRLGLYAARAANPNTPPCIEPLPQDRRFAGAAWGRWPFNLIYQSFLLTQQLWHNATTGVPGVAGHHEEVVSFAARQALDVFAPSNWPLTNPEVLAATIAHGGTNLGRGAMHLAEDWGRAVSGRRPLGTEAFQVGKAGAPRARALRPRLDHEVLHPRSFPAQFAGEIPCGARPLRLHDLLGEPRAGGPGPGHGGLPHPGHHGATGGHRGHRSQAPGPWGGVLPGRHAARSRRRGHGARGATRSGGGRSR